MPRFERPGAIAMLLLLVAAGAARAETLTIVTWGGAYEASQRAAYFEPFTAETGIEIEVVRYDGGLDEVRAHLDRRADGAKGGGGAPTWDIVDMVLPDAERACATGLIAPIDPEILAPAPDGTPAQADFMDNAIGRCWVAQLVYSTVFAYDERAFPGLKPRSVVDFFDVEGFPGTRALQRAPIAILEWALLSYDVPRAQIYDLLSTKRGLDLAFKRLDRLRGHIRWWRDGSLPPKLLESGEAALATGYNGRFFTAIAERDAPIAIVWDGQLLDQATWTVLAGADNAEAARRFIAFATRADRMAAQASLISYGPTRRSARARIGRYADSNIPMGPHLPTAPRHMERAIMQDHAWYARTERLRRRRFDAWLETLPGPGE